MAKITLVTGSRNSNKTDELAKWCQINNGIMWCRSTIQAKQIKDKYGIETMTFTDSESLKGLNKPVALNDFFFHPLIIKFMSFACFQSRGKIEITLNKEEELFELKMIPEEKEK